MRLEEAIKAAEARKSASLNTEQVGLVFSDNDFQDRAVFSGFDLNHADLVETSNRIGWYFTQMASNIGLRPLFTAAWTDGLLVGLLAASLPPDPEPDANAGSGEGET